MFFERLGVIPATCCNPEYAKGSRQKGQASRDRYRRDGKAREIVAVAKRVLGGCIIIAGMYELNVPRVVAVARGVFEIYACRRAST